MYKSEKFRGVSEYKRNGVVTKVIIPQGLEGLAKHDFDIDAETKSVIFNDAKKEEVQGGSPYIICSSFGVRSEAIINYFFINGGIVVELAVGVLYMKESDGSIVEISDDGKIKPSSIDEEDIFWVDYYDYLKHNAKIMVQHKYNLKSHLVDSYIDNLAFTMSLECIGDKEKLFRSKILNYFVDLGVNEFEFIAYKREEEYDNGFVPNQTRKEKYINDEDPYIDEDLDDEDLDDEELEDDINEDDSEDDMDNYDE